MLVMAGGKIYAARDRYGRTPVSIAKKDGAMAVAMETSAYPNLGFEFERDLGPAEIVLIDADSVNYSPSCTFSDGEIKMLLDQIRRGY